jgi:hypothetical protein
LELLKALLKRRRIWYRVSLGWYSTTIGLSGLVASVVSGQLWDRVNHGAVFIYGAAFGVLGFISLMILIPNQQNKNVLA